MTRILEMEIDGAEVLTLAEDVERVELTIKFSDGHQLSFFFDDDVDDDEITASILLLKDGKRIAYPGLDVDLGDVFDWFPPPETGAPGDGS